MNSKHLESVNSISTILKILYYILKLNQCNHPLAEWGWQNSLIGEIRVLLYYFFATAMVYISKK